MPVFRCVHVHFLNVWLEILPLLKPFRQYINCPISQHKNLHFGMHKRVNILQFLSFDDICVHLNKEEIH